MEEERSGNLASGYHSSTEGQGEGPALAQGTMAPPLPFTHHLGSSLSPARPSLLSPLRKECLVSSSGNDNTENGLPGSKAEEKAPKKV